jgi:glycerol uptake facilitator-like aquaporin
MRARVLSEALGTGLLAVVVVGSGLMGQRLFPGQDGPALLANSLATAGGLYALILTFGPVGGAHFNPVVTLASAWTGAQPWREVGPYLLAQAVGGVLGVMATHAMFGAPLVEASPHLRGGAALWWSEVLGTAVLVLVILLTRRRNPGATPGAVAALVGGGYWFTASTFFTNPALTLARACTASFAGIAWASVPGFVAAQGAGLLLGLGLARVLDEAP